MGANPTLPEPSDPTINIAPGPTPTDTPQVMIENMMARDAAEGIGAFIEKRTPHWEDR